MPKSLKFLRTHPASQAASPPYRVITDLLGIDPKLELRWAFKERRWEVWHETAAGQDYLVFHHYGNPEDGLVDAVRKAWRLSTAGVEQTETEKAEALENVDRAMREAEDANIAAADRADHEQRKPVTVAYGGSHAADAR